MIITELLKKQNMSQYRLSKESGVGQATISDLCSGKTSIQKCSAGTLYKIAKVLGVSVDAMIETDLGKAHDAEYRSSFEIFKSRVCHQVKDMGDIDFIISTLESDEIRILFEKSWYPESLYLLAMVDYLSRLNELPICRNYNDIRCRKLEKPVYPSGVVLQSAIMNSEEYMEKARKEAIPEFIRFNIVESDIRNVV